MKLSEELIWRGYQAETTIKDPTSLDNRENKQFYWGADPSADSLTIGNLAALMMCACFIKHGYKPYLLVGGATGQIGDPKDTGERDLKSLEEIERNKNSIRAQIERIVRNYLALTSGNPEKTNTPVEVEKDGITMVDNLDWFKNMNYLDFLRTVGKSFSMTQLMDRKFIQSRMGEGGSGISYAEFSYTLIQGYDFLHLYQEYGVNLQLCGADQYGNCSSGIHLIRRIENAEADAWSIPLVIDPVTGRKFGKSEGNAVWLSAGQTENITTVFDFYQFWFNQADSAVEYLLKNYSYYSKEEIESILSEHNEAPEKRIAQRALAKSVTEVVHGTKNAEIAIMATEKLFQKDYVPSKEDVLDLGNILVSGTAEGNILDTLVKFELATSKGEARKLIKAGAISFNGQKVTDEAFSVPEAGLLKKGKNKFVIIK